MTDPRTPCAVQGCHRSTKGMWGWWLCKQCYALVPLGIRRRHHRLKAYFKKRGQVVVTKRSWSTTTRRSWRVMDAAARSMIRAATNRARGL